MKIQSLFLSINFTIGLPEMIVLLFVAILLGFSIHFYWAGRKTPAPDMEDDSLVQAPGISKSDESRLKMYEQMEIQEKTKECLEKEISRARANEKLLIGQMEEMQNEINLLEDRIAGKKELSSADYISELANAQQNIEDNNRQVSRLLQQLSLLKDAERKNIDILKSNDALNNEISALSHALAVKESEIQHFRRYELLSKEMDERLQQAHEEFALLQNKLQKLESGMVPANKHFEYDELQQSYFRITKECDEIKLRNLFLLEENHRLSRTLIDTEEKLRESNFQRHQLSKKTAFLEELSSDLQQASGHHKKLEGQFRRISEIESLLSQASADAYRERL